MASGLDGRSGVSCGQAAAGRRKSRNLTSSPFSDV